MSTSGVGSPHCFQCGNGESKMIFDTATATMIKPSQITPISCTHDQCQNRTTKHKHLSAEEIKARGLTGQGWYCCQDCGTVRQHVRNSGRLPKQPPNF